MLTSLTAPVLTAKKWLLQEPNSRCPDYVLSSQLVSQLSLFLKIKRRTTGIVGKIIISHEGPFQTHLAFLTHSLKTRSFQGHCDNQKHFHTFPADP